MSVDGGAREAPVKGEEGSAGILLRGFALQDEAEVEDEVIDTQTVNVCPSWRPKGNSELLVTYR